MNRDFLRDYSIHDVQGPVNRYLGGLSVPAETVAKDLWRDKERVAGLFEEIIKMLESISTKDEFKHQRAVELLRHIDQIRQKEQNDTGK
jgi:hypothetical protein